MCPPYIRYGFSKTQVYDIRFFSIGLGQKSLVCLSFVVSYLSELISYSANPGVDNVVGFPQSAHTCPGAVPGETSEFSKISAFFPDIVHHASPRSEGEWEDECVAKIELAHSFSRSPKSKIKRENLKWRTIQKPKSRRRKCNFLKVCVSKS